MILESHDIINGEFGTYDRIDINTQNKFFEFSLPISETSASALQSSCTQNKSSIHPCLR